MAGCRHIRKFHNLGPIQDSRFRLLPANNIRLEVNLNTLYFLLHIASCWSLVVSVSQIIGPHAKMPLKYEPEYQAAIAPLLPLLSKRQRLSLEDIPGARAGREAGISAFFNQLDDSPDVQQTTHSIKSTEGRVIPVLAFQKKGDIAIPGPALLHFHGGGMILGSAKLQAKPLAQIVSQTSVSIFSVDYRLAPEYKDTAAVEDGYTALLWLHDNALEFGVDPSRIGVFGESAGGGVAAGLAIMARDKGQMPPIAKQILVYPMIDDTNTVADEIMEPFAFWKTEDNALAWAALLGDKAGNLQAAVSPYAAPARATNVAGLPEAYIDVGALDIFRDENIRFATRLLAENISVELHVYPGLPHAFEMVAPKISWTRIAFENRCKAIQGF